MPKSLETVLEIDLNALRHNYEFLKSKCRKDIKSLAVVKAFAYGSNAPIIATALEKLKVDYFAVAYVHEGVSLRKAGIKSPILVLHPQPTNFEEIIDHCLEPNLYSMRVLRSFLNVALKKEQSNYPVHIKFNTGLNRLGFWENDIDPIIKELSNANQVKVRSIFSHLAASEDINERSFSLKQIASFKAIAQEFEKKIGYRPLQHQLNTSGIINYSKEAQFDMVRMGIGLYGFANDQKITSQLQNVMRLKSVISQIHSIEKGETVGYNRAFKAPDFIKTATIPIGHADGIHRAFGNGKGFVSIAGKRASIIGNVCMDMIMVDINDIDCLEGDEVIIFDNQENLNALANAIDTISYELLTAISQRVKRVVK